MTSSGAQTDSIQRVFISYRRSDCQAQANGLYDGLSHRLSNVRIFMDIDSIPPGVDFEAHIRTEINSCDVVLVMIGDNWLDPAHGTASRRIDDPDDFVRLEISSALALEHVKVIPVLVEGAEMPHSTDLPPDIQRLARYNAIELSDKRWTSDLARLAQLLEDLAEKPAPEPAAPAPANPPTAATPPAPSWPAPPVPNAQAPGWPAQAPPRAPAPGWPAQAMPNAQAPGWPAQAVPRPAQRSAGSTWWANCGMVALPLFTCGLASFVTPLWVIRQRPNEPALKRRMIIATVALGLAAVAGMIMVGASPTDKEGNATGALSSVGVGFVFVAMLVGVVLGFVYRRPADSQPTGRGGTTSP